MKRLSLFNQGHFRWVLAICLPLLYSQFSFAQDSAKVAEPNSIKKGTFTIGAQIRPRFEHRNGFKRPLVDTLNAASFVEQRTRIWLDYLTDDFHIHVNLQDVRMWGGTSSIYKTDQSLFNAYEAYAEYFINKNWAMKVGRQAINYDGARFFGNLDWAQQGRSHDALLLKYENEGGTSVHFGGGLNQFQNEPSYLSYEKYNNNNNKWMAFARFHKKWEKIEAAVLVQNDAREKADSSNASRQTVAIIPQWHINDKSNLAFEFYYQMGENAAAQDVNAFFASAIFTYKTNRTPIIIGGEYASGTQWDAEDNVDNSWNPLYGTNHKFYGHMDYFYVGNGHGQAAGRAGGLIDLYLKTNFKLGKKNMHFLKAHVHQFLSPVEVRDLREAEPTTLSTTLGTEIDLMYVWKPKKGIDGILGYSQMFGSESLNQMKGLPGANVQTSYWIWAQLNFKMDLFKHKMK